MGSYEFSLYIVPTLIQRKRSHTYGIDRDKYMECILKAQVPDVSMHPSPCTDVDDLIRCSATVGNLGERGHPYLGKALGYFACAKDRSKYTGPPF